MMRLDEERLTQEIGYNIEGTIYLTRDSFDF